jgi:eukaryotic-like serine/threonine-protein kinase
VVAIKELIQETPERAARFEREALITARLQHPAIANLHEAGRWPSGQPFYAMKLVAGRSLGQAAAELRPLAERLALLPNLIAMVEAVAYAHRQRIIHRDLKPSNVLIGDLGETVVIDWGLAKDLAAEPGDRTHLPAPGGTDETVEARSRDRAPPDGAARVRDGQSSSGSLTIAGSVMGTPGFMPPEQASGEDVDERADVYALGAILYQVLGGAEPYQGKTTDAILAAVLAGPPVALARVEPRLPQDLLTIIEKAMARARESRYPTAVQLAEDLRRFQTGQLVAARRYSRRALAWRFVVRHRAAVVAAMIALVTIAVFGQVSFQRVVAERDRAEAASVAAARRADQLSVAQAGTLLDKDPRAALDLLARLSPDAPASIWRTARMVASEARLRGIPSLLRGHDSRVGDCEVSPDGESMVSVDQHAVRVWDLESGQSRLVGRHPSLIHRVRISPDRKFAVTVSLDNRIRQWALDTGLVTEIGAHDGLVTALNLLPDGSGAVTSGVEGAVWLWRLGGGEHRLLGKHQGKALDVDVSDDGSTVASVGDDGVARVWRLDGREPVRELRGDASHFLVVALSGDGSRVAAVGAPKEVWLWDVATGKGARLAGHDKEVWTADFSADGHLLATAGADRTIRLWDVQTGESEVLLDHEDGVSKVTFAGGSDLLFSHSLDGTARVWMLDEKSASVVQVLGGHDRDSAMEVSRDGSQVVTTLGSLMRRWQVAARRGILRGHRSAVTQVEFAGKGAVVSAGADWTVRLWRLGGRVEEAVVMRGHQAAVAFLAVSPDGRFAASIDESRFVMLWDLASGRGRELSGRAYGEPRFTMDGGILLAPSDDYAVRLWSTASGEARLLRGHTGWVTALALSPDGRTLATGGADRTVRLWDFGSGAGRILEGHGSMVRHVEFAGSGHVVSSDLGGGVFEWDVAGGAGRPLARGGTGVPTLAASRDGQLVAWADGEGDAHLWDRQSGQGRVLVRREKGIDQLRFSPDGRTLLGRDTGNRILLWDIATEAVLVLPSHGRTVADFAVSPDSLLVATADSDRSVRLWSYDLPYEAGKLRAWLAGAAGAHEKRK